MPPKTAIVILVDDHEDSRAMYALMLSHAGFHVVAAATAEEALGLAQQLQPDAVVTDVRLAGASGLELAQRLRADARTREMAILVLTGDIRARDHGPDVGFDRFLLKPFPPSALADEITATLAERARIAGDDSHQSKARLLH